MKTTTLYFKQGSSDKVYQASIEPKDGLFLVNFAFGRRGSTMNTGTKTPVPVDEDTATKIFEKLIKGKQAKGYTEGPNGSPYQHTSNESKLSGIVPQLLNPIGEEELEKYLADANWCLQEKYDGKRFLLIKQGGSVQGINRKGLFVGVSQLIVTQALRIDVDFIMDGEAVGDFYYAFDLLKVNGGALTQAEYRERYRHLQTRIVPLGVCNLRCAVTCTEEKIKREHLTLLKKVHAEGVVLKRLDAPYTPGRPASGGTQLKCKFYATASFIVGTVNKSKRSVGLSLFSGLLQVDAGNVTVPVNLPIPKAGTIVEVRYLYAFKESGAVYQPVLLGARDDLSPQDCRTDQLKFKQATEEEDSELAA